MRKIRVANAKWTLRTPLRPPAPAHHGRLEEWAEEIGCEIRYKGNDYLKGYRSDDEVCRLLHSQYVSIGKEMRGIGGCRASARNGLIRNLKREGFVRVVLNPQIRRDRHTERHTTLEQVPSDLS